MMTRLDYDSVDNDAVDDYIDDGVDDEEEEDNG